MKLVPNKFPDLPILVITQLVYSKSTQTVSVACQIINKLEILYNVNIFFDVQEKLFNERLVELFSLIYHHIL